MLFRSITADVLADIYVDLLRSYYGDSLDYDEQARITWARIPHFFATPYYVYQYATCFASSAQLMAQVTEGSEASRAAAVDRYLTLLKSGGSDHPMALLKLAGVDLGRPETVRAVVTQLDNLVTRLDPPWRVHVGWTGRSGRSPRLRLRRTQKANARSESQGEKAPAE